MLMMMGFQDRSVTALMTLIGFSAEVGYFQEVLENANGTVMTVFERRMQAISSKLTAAWHEVKGLAGSFGEALVPVLERAIDAMKAMAKWFNGLSTNTQQWIVTLFAAAVALGPIVYLAGLVIQGLGGMVMAVGYMIKGFQIFTKVAMAATASQWAFVASAAALLALGYYGAQAWPSMRKYNEELKKSIALNKKLNDREQKKQSGVIEEIEKIKNPVEKLKRVNDELDMANKNLSGIRVQLGLNRQAAEEYADSLVSDTFSRFAGNKVLEDFEMERQNLLKREAYYQEHAERLLEIQGKSKAQIEKIMKEAAESGKNPHKGLVDPELFEQQQEGVRDTIDALEQQQRELTMTERDLLKYKMAAIEAGDAATEYALSLYDANKALEKQQAAQKAADETAASMLEELAFFGKTAAEIAILKAEMSGLVDQKTIDKMKEYNKALIGMKAHKKLMKEGAAVTEKFKSEGQKASERAQKLVEMFHKGAISGQTFVKAMRDLHEQFREDFVAKFKSTGTEALRADSAEGELAAMDQLQMQQANKAYRELSNSHIMGAVAKYEKAQGLKPGEVSSRLGRQQPKKQAPPRKRKKNELPTGPGTGFANTEMTEALKAIRENTGRPPIVVQEAGFETV
jgi:uncharacterized protein YqgQ